MGDLVELPRKLEWSPTEAWVAEVKGTALTAKVEKVMNSDQWFWAAWNGSLMVGSGREDDPDEAREAAKKCLESLKVLRPLDDDGIFKGMT